MDGEAARSADEGEVFRNRDGAIVEEHVMVRAQAEDIVCGIRTIVWSAERPNMRGL